MNNLGDGDLMSQALQFIRSTKEIGYQREWSESVRAVDGAVDILLGIVAFKAEGFADETSWAFLLLVDLEVKDLDCIKRSLLQ